MSVIFKKTARKIFVYNVSIFEFHYFPLFVEKVSHPDMRVFMRTQKYPV